MSLTFTADIEYLKNRLNDNQHSPDKIKAAKYYLNNGDTQKAIELCKESLNDYPNYLTTYLILANSYISESDFATAEETIKKADEHFPRHWAFDSIKKLIWQSDLTVSTNSKSKNTPHFEEIHRLLLSSDNSDIENDFEDMTDPIVAMKKFSFDFDDYVPGQNASNDNSLTNGNDDYNPFRPAPNDFAFDNDDIIKSLLNNKEVDAILMPKEAWNNIGIVLSPEYKELLDKEGIKLEPMAPPTPIKINTPDKIILENELNQLLGNSDDLEGIKDGAIEDLSDIDNLIQDEKPNSPPLVSKTMADVYISQGKYNEAISIYSELLKKKEITIKEYDINMQALQEKMSPPEIDI